MGKPPATARHLIKGEHTTLKGDFPGNSRCTCGNVNLMIIGYLMRQEIIVIASKLIITIATACMHAYTLHYHQ